MGISVYDAVMMAGSTRAQARKGTVVCLGVPKISFSSRSLKKWCERIGVDWKGPADGAAVNDQPMTPTSFFLSLGYSRCIALDISAYEGAQIVHDLNQPELAEQHRDIASCVVDCGTLEHVFDIPAALRTIGALLETDGIVLHVTPCNGYLDHGFYQVSPTLFYDFYSANGFRIVSANLLNRYPVVRCEPYVEDVYRHRDPLYGVRTMRRSTNFFAAAKTADSTSDRVPTQSYYREVHGGPVQQYSAEVGFSYAFAPSFLRRVAGRVLRRVRAQ